MHSKKLTNKIDQKIIIIHKTDFVFVLNLSRNKIIKKEKPYYLIKNKQNEKSNIFNITIFILSIVEIRLECLCDSFFY
jgi:hypothetical protein